MSKEKPEDGDMPEWWTNLNWMGRFGFVSGVFVSLLMAANLSDAWFGTSIVPWWMKFGGGPGR